MVALMEVGWKAEATQVAALEASAVEETAVAAVAVVRTDEP
jgi:hypothetical protein